MWRGALQARSGGCDVKVLAPTAKQQQHCWSKRPQTLPGCSKESWRGWVPAARSGFRRCCHPKLIQPRSRPSTFSPIIGRVSTEANRPGTPSTCLSRVTYGLRSVPSGSLIYFKIYDVDEDGPNMPIGRRKQHRTWSLNPLPFDAKWVFPLIPPF